MPCHGCALNSSPSSFASGSAFSLLIASPRRFILPEPRASAKNEWRERPGARRPLQGSAEGSGAAGGPWALCEPVVFASGQIVADVLDGSFGQTAQRLAGLKAQM